MIDDKYLKIFSEKEITNYFKHILINEYGYSANEIVFEAPIKNNIRADIIIYKSEVRYEPHILIEVKKGNIHPLLAAQAINYCREINCEYAVLTNGKEKICYKIINGQALEIPDIPKKGEVFKSIAKNQLKISKKLDLKLWRIMDILRSKSKLTPIENIEEINKLIFCKIIDEKKNRQKIEFQIDFNEAKKINDLNIQKKLFSRIENLFHTVKKEYPGIFHKDDIIKLDPITLFHIVSELQSYSFTKAPLNFIVDSYEKIIQRNMKTSYDEFTTPRQIVEFIVRLLGPTKEDIILDPACGSGGFLLKVIQNIWQNENKKSFFEVNHQNVKNNYIKNKLFGLDINQKMVFTSKMNLFFNGASSPNIFQTNSLLKSEIPEQIKKIINNGGFDIIMTNLPIGFVNFNNEFIEIYKSIKPNKKQRIELLFIERCMQFLKAGGTFAAIVPESILFNESFNYIRKYLLKNGIIKAIISLPNNSFIPYGPAIKTSILIIEKIKTGESIKDYNIFMAEVKNVGVAERNNLFLSADFNIILEQYQNLKQNRTIRTISKPKVFTLNISELGNNWAVEKCDPTFSQKDFYVKIENRLKKVGGTIRKLEDIAELIKGISVPSKIYLDIFNEKNIPYIRIGDMQNGSISLFNLKYINKEDIKLSYKAWLKPDDILISISGTIGKIAIVPNNIKKGIISSGIIIIRPNTKFIDINYLALILSSDMLKSQLDILKTGSYIKHISIKNIKQLKIPLPPIAEQRKIVKKIKELKLKNINLKIERNKIQQKISKILKGED